jgi:hypothetical protein
MQRKQHSQPLTHPCAHSRGRAIARDRVNPVTHPCALQPHAKTCVHPWRGLASEQTYVIGTEPRRAAKHVRHGLIEAVYVIPARYDTTTHAHTTTRTHPHTHTETNDSHIK